jgi:hypothetical protein
VFNSVKTSYDLHVENCNLFLDEKLGKLLRDKKLHQVAIKENKEEVDNLTKRFIALMEQGGIESVDLGDGLEVVYIKENVRRKPLPLHKIIDIIMELELDAISSEELEELFTKETTTKAHIRVMSKKTE